jgi:hypothetical protein
MLQAHILSCCVVTALLLVYSARILIVTVLLQCRLVVQCLHERSLEDRQFGMKAAVVCGFVASLEVEGVKLRNIVLLAVQKDFEGKTFRNQV